MTLISEDYLFEVIKDYFKKNGVSDIQKESYNYLITNTIQQIINEDPIIKIPIKQNQYFIITLLKTILPTNYNFIIFCHLHTSISLENWKNTFNSKSMIF